MTKMLIDRSTVEQALEVLEAGPDVDPIFAGETEDALRAALAEPVQEPQGCDHCNHPLYAAIKCRVCGRVTEPTPPQRKPLSGVAIYGLFVRSGLGAYHQKDFVVQTEYDRCIERFARAIELAHGIKE